MGDRHHGPPGYLSIAQAAKRLGVSRGTVHVMCQRGQLGKITLGMRDYVPEAHVNAVMVGLVATAATSGVVAAFSAVLDEYPGLAERLRVLADEGGAS
jgi:excisionase family DNA binding protein